MRCFEADPRRWTPPDPLPISPIAQTAGRRDRSRPTPARDGIRAIVIEVALKYPMWGHRKIAWLAGHEHALDACDATCLRILREAGLALPVDYVRERRDFAGARREAFVDLPTRRNRVWQRTSLSSRPRAAARGAPVMSSTNATKLVLAGPAAMQTTRDAIASMQLALNTAASLLGPPLINDLTDRATGEITPIFLISENGPCSRAQASRASIDSQPSFGMSAHAGAHRRPTASSSATTARSRSKRCGATCPPTASR